MLGTPPALGRIFREEEFRSGAPPVAVLSDRLWKRRFGRDPGVLGRPLILNGTAHTIIGVMPPEFFFEQRFELWTPWLFTADESSRRESRTTTFARLKPGVRREKAEAETLAVLREIAAEDVKKGWSMRVVGAADELTSRVRSSLLVSLGAVGFVLLIACINVANLLLARASDRAHEISIRVALGAGRSKVIGQFLGESMALATAGGALGVLVGNWSAKGLVALLPERMPVPRITQTRLDGQVLLFTLGLALATGVVFGLIPALAASRVDVTDRLKEGGRGTSGGTRGRRIRSVLVVAETALSLVLVTGAGLMLRSFDRLMRVDPGFQAERVLTMRVPLPTGITERPRQAAYYTRLLDRLRAMTGVNSAGLVTPLPLGEVESNATFATEGHPAPPGERQLVRLRVVSPGYFRAMGIAVRRGRVFGEGDGDGAPAVAVINEALARKYFPNEDPVGRRVTMNEAGTGPFMEVVGLIRDVKTGQQLSGETTPELYRDYRQFFFAGFAAALTLRSEGADPEQLAGAAQKEIRAANPDQPVSDVRSMSKVVSDAVSTPRFYTLLLSAYAGIALALAATGLYGVLSYSVSRRAHEIGVRMAMGANGRSIFRLVIVEALRLAGIGIALGIGGGLALTRLIATQLFQTAPTDPLTFAAVSALMLAVAIAAACVPAMRALRLDPVQALWGRS
jgi:putative ABC transport system permease protein